MTTHERALQSIVHTGPGNVAISSFGYQYDEVWEMGNGVSGKWGQCAYSCIPDMMTHERALQSIVHTGPGNAAISSFGYQYDEVGQIKEWTQSRAWPTMQASAQWKLTMDGSDQLTGISVTGQPGLAEAFGYDEGGNRVTRQKGNALTTTGYNALNQIQTVTAGGKFRVAGATDEAADVTVQGAAARMLSATNFVAFPSVNAGTNVIPVVATDGSGNSRTNSYQVVVPSAAARTFGYDANGNLLDDGIRTYQWDGLNRLVKVTLGTDVYEWTYDGMNRRVSETKNGALSKHFIWDGMSLIEERDAANAVTRRFLPQGEVQGSMALFYTRDHLGSVREVTDAAGAVVTGYSYDAWGKRTLLAGTDQAGPGYTGHYEHPELHLLFAPFRAYDPETGRWLSRDPIGEAGGINLYGYVGNDPVNLVDPLGLEDTHLVLYRDSANRNSPGTMYIFSGDAYIGSVRTNEGGYAKQNQGLRPGTYFLLPKPQSQMDKVPNPFEFELNTPSVTHPDFLDQPGRAGPGYDKPTIRLHDEGHTKPSSTGCVTVTNGVADIIKDMMLDSLRNGDTVTLEVLYPDSSGAKVAQPIW